MGNATVSHRQAQGVRDFTKLHCKRSGRKFSCKFIVKLEENAAILLYGVRCLKKWMERMEME